MNLESFRTKYLNIYNKMERKYSTSSSTKEFVDDDGFNINLKKGKKIQKLVKVKTEILRFSVINNLDFIELNFDHVFQTLSELAKCIERRDSYDTLISFLTGVYIILDIPHQSNIQKRNIFNLTSDLILRVDPRTSEKGDSLLHLSVTTSSIIKSFATSKSFATPRFPSASVTMFLLNCGADINSTNDEGCSPLFSALMDEHDEITTLLLNSGAHVDQITSLGERPCRYLKNPKFKILNYVSLKCLAARIIQEYDINYLGKVPTILESFIELH